MQWWTKAVLGECTMNGESNIVVFFPPALLGYSPWTSQDFSVSFAWAGPALWLQRGYFSGCRRNLFVLDPFRILNLFFSLFNNFIFFDILDRSCLKYSWNFSLVLRWQLDFREFVMLPRHLLDSLWGSSRTWQTKEGTLHSGSTNGVQGRRVAKLTKALASSSLTLCFDIPAVARVPTRYGLRHEITWEITWGRWGRG